MNYQHFSIEERELIQRRLWEKRSVRAIAKEFQRSPSSISREINRNIPLKRSYKPRLAHERALIQRKNRGRKSRLKSWFIRRYVISKLRAGYSPEQIAGRLSLEHPTESISHEAIYQYIYATIHRGGHGTPKPGYPDLRIYLKRRHKRRIKKGLRKGQRVFKPKGPSIDIRPPEVATRLTLGHWEGDTVVSKGNRDGINTLVERKTGLVFITRVRDKTTHSTTTAIASRLAPLPSPAKATLTLDNGFENGGWQDIEHKVNTRVFFAHPYHSWERGTNENTNGLIRWYFPKGTNFATIPDETIQAVEQALNSRPRKRLGWKTPLETFNESVALLG